MTAYPLHAERLIPNEVRHLSACKIPNGVREARTEFVKQAQRKCQQSGGARRQKRGVLAVFRSEREQDPDRGSLSGRHAGVGNPDERSDQNAARARISGRNEGQMDRVSAEIVRKIGRNQGAENASADEAGPQIPNGVSEASVGNPKARGGKIPNGVSEASATQVPAIRRRAAT